MNGKEAAGKKISILDVSDEPSIFSLMLAERFPQNMVTCAISQEMPKVSLPSNVSTFKFDKFTDIENVIFFLIIY